MGSKRALLTVFRYTLAPPLYLLGMVFFDRKYLRGRHFESHFTGWRWMLRSIVTQKILGYNRAVRFPVSPFIAISSSKNLEFHPDDLNNFQHFGCYFQNFDGRIRIGRGTYIAPNVGIITVNHDPLDPSHHLPGKDITIGENCWIGMNAVILPGVTLGDGVVVGAGSVVTKSFPGGKCVIGGTPAKLIKMLVPEGGTQG